MSISTHVLDTARGRPATGVAVTLSRRDAKGAWSQVANAVTDADGRVKEFSTARHEPGEYRLQFDIRTYFEAAAFYPEVSIVFTVRDGGAHHHVPLLIAPFGYSTYRGT